MEKVDKSDRKLISILSKDARMSLKEVSEVSGLSRSSVHQRIERMRRDGVIFGSGFMVNPKAVGYGTCTYVGISLERGSMYRSVVKKLEKIPEIVECHFTTGPYTMLVKAYVKDNEQLMSLLNDTLQCIDGVMSTETLISLDQSIMRDVPITFED